MLHESFRDRKVFGQLVAEFRYGREQDEVMGLHFSKELYLASEQIYPMNKKFEETKTQEKLISKLGPNAFPFNFKVNLTKLYPFRFHCVSINLFIFFF